MRGDLTHEMWKAGTADAAERLCLPDVDQRALAGLKFNEALPERLATATLAARHGGPRLRRTGPRRARSLHHHRRALTPRAVFVKPRICMSRSIVIILEYVY